MRELAIEIAEKEAKHDDSDYQYFEWLSDNQWYEYVQQKQSEFHKLYGWGMEFKIQWDNWCLMNV